MELGVGAELQATARLRGVERKKWGAGRSGVPGVRGGGRAELQARGKGSCHCAYVIKEVVGVCKRGPPGPWNSRKGQRSPCF